MTWATPELQSHPNVLHTKTPYSSWESVSSLRFSVSGHSRRVVIFSGSRRMSMMVFIVMVFMERGVHFYYKSRVLIARAE